MTFLERTTDARRLRHWEGDIEADYIYTTGIAGEKFFTALRDEGRLYAIRCPACRVTYLPPRVFCERCLRGLEDWVEVPPTGRVAAVTVSYRDRRGGPIPTPEVWAFVTFQGIHGGLVHRLLVPKEAAKAGLPVRIRIKDRESRTGAITDLEGFEPAGA